MPHPRRSVTLHDVAADAGVSVATASRVLGGSSRSVAPEYRDRVLAAAARLRYTADVSARAMRTSSDALALVADDITTPSIAIVVAAMERQARAKGAFVTVSATRGVPARQLETIRQLRALRPRALVLTSGRIDADALSGRLLAELQAYQGDGGRVVVVGDTDLPFHSIRFDNYRAATEIGRHVALTGHRRVVILAGERAQAAMSARTEGFLAGLRDGDVADVRVVHCEVSRQGGFTAARRLASDFDAVMAANDLIAVGALSALRAAGVEVPSDVSLTGFDDIGLAVNVTPRLTTVALPLAYAGAEAIRLALKESGPITHVTVEGRLIIRDSTARAR
ncbi:LacI family DNA-binding transcriptional regulator [Kibdelosporangium persicum]|uniref:HTH-type transcriptional regulator GalS n=1 Tax=Kibdelosporangium persicum TaxID=2698649 RepID=A0ABX2F2L5_9PSEU|nr:LacI family DNA-binding transcriptional regulator [Kibdelosporangium persicum]NRN65547.1 HTH-type transcriptional regulator GalS [Kibdelosporangium persicum]